MSVVRIAHYQEAVHNWNLSQMLNVIGLPHLTASAGDVVYITLEKGGEVFCVGRCCLQRQCSFQDWAEAHYFSDVWETDAIQLCEDFSLNPLRGTQDGLQYMTVVRSGEILRNAAIIDFLDQLFGLYALQAAEKSVKLTTTTSETVERVSILETLKRAVKSFTQLFRREDDFDEDEFEESSESGRVFENLRSLSEVEDTSVDRFVSDALPESPELEQQLLQNSSKSFLQSFDAEELIIEEEAPRLGVTKLDETLVDISSDINAKLQSITKPTSSELSRDDFDSSLLNDPGTSQVFTDLAALTENAASPSKPEAELRALQQAKRPTFTEEFALTDEEYIMEEPADRKVIEISEEDLAAELERLMRS